MILNTKTIFCSNCFKNKQIKEYIAKYGRQAHKKYFCDFCKNESTEEGSIMDAEEFIPKLTTAIYNIYEYREGLWSESKYSYGDILDERAGYIKSTEEVFDELLDCKNNDKLFNTLRKNSPEFQEVEIDTPTWVSTCRYGIESGLEKWKDFCENVKYKARYFNHDSFSVTDTLEEFNRSISEHSKRYGGIVHLDQSVIVRTIND